MVEQVRVLRIRVLRRVFNNEAQMDLYTGYSAWKYDRELLKRRVEDIARALDEPIVQAMDHDAIVLTGSSGTWLGGLLAMRLDIPVVLCRKDGERSHGSIFEGTASAKRLLLVDDFVSTGATVQRVRDQWTKYAKRGDDYCDVSAYQLIGVLQHGYIGVAEYDTYTGELHVEKHVDGIPVLSRRRG